MPCPKDARASYMFDNRDMVEVNLGYNGSENLAEGNRFGLSEFTIYDVTYTVVGSAAE